MVVVFLVGWTGCRDQHLAKYAEVYEELGLSVRLVTAHCSMWVSKLPLESRSRIAAAG